MAYKGQVAEDRVEGEVLAHSMLVIMVRGLFSRLEFPYAQFPCTDLSGLFGLVNDVCGVVHFIIITLYH